MRHWMFRILACLLLGAIATVAVAWLHAAFIDAHPLAQGPPLFDQGVTRQEYPKWDVTIRELRGSTVVWHQAIELTTPRPPQPLGNSPTPKEIEAWVRANAAYQQGLPPPSAFDDPIINVPYWSRAASAPSRVITGATYMEDARGWPFRALVSYDDAIWSGPPRNRSRAPLGHDWRWDFGDTQGRLGLPRGLPLRPILAGLLADTLLFAAVPFLIVVLYASVRARHRLRHGRCPSCGYDLRRYLESGCPECGWNRDSEATQPRSDGATKGEA